MSKLSVIAAGAVGYVLGARAGRERYEQIVQQAQRFWNDPRVQQKASEAAEVIKDKAPDVGAHLADAAKATAAKVTSNGSDNRETASR